MSSSIAGDGGAKPYAAAYITILAVLFAATLCAAPAKADSVEDFYRGKTISMIIGYSVGGGYDLYGRLVAHHIRKHIPGMPNVVPQNMTGAGSLRAAQYLYSVAPKDGTVIGTFGRTIVTTPLLTPAGPQFNGTKFTWLGSVTNEVSSCVTWHSSPVKTWEDILRHQITFGGEGPAPIRMFMRSFTRTCSAPRSSSSAVTAAPVAPRSPWNAAR